MESTWPGLSRQTIVVKVRLEGTSAQSVDRRGGSRETHPVGAIT